MKKAIWFSRHQPTQAQIDDAFHGVVLWDVEIVAVSEGMALGSINLESDEDVTKVVTEIRALVQKHQADMVLGVFPVPVQAILVAFGEADEPVTMCYAAWNIQRSQEGGKPTFTHKEWMFVGAL
jgi:hypothetical protein